MDPLLATAEVFEGFASAFGAADVPLPHAVAAPSRATARSAVRWRG
ncbi:hypothetical protein [Streptomyces sp. Inha503]